ncbi:hypothetical protein JD292_11875 [Leucobacter sp. CSA2]|uniref:Uncharacterized protein n=1 Tax=Leucobacter edaphi TaxID=2796472 RepID=A0A934QDR7_9MICO|nr:hypothetical protein [Leucobacter edaphi]
MNSRLTLTEHVEASLPDAIAREVYDAVQGLSGVLKPRRPQIARQGSTVEVKNLIGSVRLANGSILQVDPKISGLDSWPEAAVQLLTSTSRISVTGSQRSSQGESHTDLTAMIAFEFERRLSTALKKDGPVEIFERRRHVSRRIDGHLNVGAYTRRLWRDPVSFPIDRDELTIENDFARGLSIVSRVLRRSVPSSSLASKLRRLESEVVPGIALPSFLNPAVANLRLPSQWSNYRPAWDIAAAILRNKSVVNDPGHSVGLEVAVEPWPLLETLLERVLSAVERTPAAALQMRKKKNYPLLQHGSSVAGWVVPDGVLQRTDGSVAASFEAKYTSPKEHPQESHRYQALSTAAVLRAPVAVIVYPGRQAPKLYSVEGFNRQPAVLATVGLDLYGYSRFSDEKVRAEGLLQLLTQAELLLPNA